MTDSIRRYFEFEKLGTDFRTEILGGLTTFMTMAYIIVVNPGILSNQQIGAAMDFNSVLVATCLASALASLVMGIAARYPIALAPGMGLNAFFSFEIVHAYGVPWPTALGMVFVSGTVFMVLTFMRVRELLISAVPDTLKQAIACGIGLFIAFIGLQHAGVIVADPATLVRMGNLSEPSVLISLTALALAGAMMAAGVRGAVLWGILIAGGLGLLFGEIKPDNLVIPTLRPFTGAGLGLVAIMVVTAGALKLLRVKGAAALGVVAGLLIGWVAGWIEVGKGAIVAMPPSISPTAFQLDFHSLFSHPEWIALTGVLLFFDLFDTVGTLIGVSEQAGFIEDGKLPRASRALSADAFGTMAGALLGTSTVTSYIESSAGVAAGARTGFASLVTAALFLLALFFAPLAGLLAVGMVTAPALILVGILMMGGVSRIPWKDVSHAAPAFLVMILMPLSFSISKGLVAGFIAWPVCQVAAGRAREVHPFIYALAAVLIAAVAVSFFI